MERTAPGGDPGGGAKLARMRTSVLPRIAVAAVATMLLIPAPGLAQQAPTLGAPSTDATPTTAISTTSSTGGGGLETWQEALIFAAGLILIGGIAFAILGDARDRARELGGAGGSGAEAATVPHRHRQQSKQRARAKGKAARAQRRRNR
jgi:hypothetical protein